MDKLLHFIVGFGSSFVVGVRSPLAGLVVSLLLGAGKEFYDAFGYGTPELADFLATVSGGVVSLIFWKLCENFRFEKE